MPKESKSRAMTPEERSSLEEMLKEARAVRPWKVAFTGFVATWVFSILLVLVVYRALSWLNLISFSDLGVAILIVVAGILSAAYMLRWVLSLKDNQAPMVRDLKGGVVAEESLEFDAAKRFQEPEHGGLLYFLRTAGNRVFVLYDYESQDLGAAGKDPLKSPFRARRYLRLARAPVSRVVLGQKLSGPELEIEATHQLGLPPDEWPESEEYCRISWDHLEKRLGATERKGAT